MPTAKSFIVLTLLFSLAPAALADPKAYELVKYRGAAEGVTFAFDFGDGYPEGSEMRIKQGRREKSRTFVLADGDQMRFVPEKNRTSGEEVILEMGIDDGPAERVKGEYRVGRKTIRFSLRQLGD